MVVEVAAAKAASIFKDDVVYVKARRNARHTEYWIAIE
jgi:hypothetical protein